MNKGPGDFFKLLKKGGDKAKGKAKDAKSKVTGKLKKRKPLTPSLLGGDSGPTLGSGL